MKILMCLVAMVSFIPAASAQYGAGVLRAPGYHAGRVFYPGYGQGYAPLLAPSYGYGVPALAPPACAGAYAAPAYDAPPPCTGAFGLAYAPQLAPACPGAGIGYAPGYGIGAGFVPAFIPGAGYGGVYRAGVGYGVTGRLFAPGAVYGAFPGYLNTPRAAILARAAFPVLGRAAFPILRRGLFRPAAFRGPVFAPRRGVVFRR